MIYYFLYYLGLILTSKPLGNLSKSELFFTYTKLKIKHLLLEVILGKRLYWESLFGFKISCISYSSLIMMFEEIFILNVYYFKSERKEPKIIDCGSNIGVSILFFKIVYPKSQIFAFEPDVEAFGTLKKNIQDNKFKNVTLLNKAVYGTEKTINFYYDEMGKGSLGMGISRRGGSFLKKVDTVLLSSFLKKRVDFLKLDIEGSEGSVITELVRAGKLKKINETVIEFHHHLGVKGNILSKLLFVLEKENFDYQIRSQFRTPFFRDSFQDVLIYAYLK